MHSCPLCQQLNHCLASEQCWCTKVTIPDALLAQIPEQDKNKKCLCKACITAYSANYSNAAQKQPAKD